MESLPINSVLEFKPDTLQYVRKQYGLDKPGRMNEAIDILEEWIKKQEHFEKKCFRRDILERIIIFNKGLIERCKQKIDKLCTMRTIMPEMFAMTDYKNHDFYRYFTDTFLPKMTPDYGRVHLFKLDKCDKKYDPCIINANVKYFVLTNEYLQTHDYCNHVTYVLDWRHANITEYMMALNIVEFQKALDIALEAGHMRINGIHFVTTSKAIDVFVAIFKPVLNKKISRRIHLHKTIESIYDFVPKDILPREYGGNEKSLAEMCVNQNNEISSTAFTEYRKEMQKARTNERYRPRDTFNDKYMGLAGTFRNFKVD